MKKIKYSPDAADKLRVIKQGISDLYGKSIASKILKIITKQIRKLEMNDKLGLSVESMFDIPSEYRYIYVMHNYIFYKVEHDYIRIINIYYEKEDFMWQLFGIDTTPHETYTYWD